MGRQGMEETRESRVGLAGGNWSGVCAGRGARAERAGNERWREAVGRLRAPLARVVLCTCGLSR